LESQKGRDHVDNLCVDGRIILEWIHKQYTNYEIFYLIHKQKKKQKIGILILMGKYTLLICWENYLIS
jgi:hypothetical protein